MCSRWFCLRENSGGPSSFESGLWSWQGQDTLLALWRRPCWFLPLLLQSNRLSLLRLSSNWPLTGGLLQGWSNWQDRTDPLHPVKLGVPHPEAGDFCMNCRTEKGVRCSCVTGQLPSLTPETQNSLSAVVAPHGGLNTHTAEFCVAHEPEWVACMCMVSSSRQWTLWFILAQRKAEVWMRHPVSTSSPPTNDSQRRSTKPNMGITPGSCSTHNDWPEFLGPVQYTNLDNCCKPKAFVLGT